MSPPRVLLVYANPANTASPVPPYGMERLSRCFQLAGCVVRMLTPFIEADPAADLSAALAWEPDLVGFSVRNVDDALVVRTELGPNPIDLTFYLDAVRPLVQLAIARVGQDRVLLGGPAISTGPTPVLRFLGARHGVRGPADDIAWQIGRSLARGEGVVLPDDHRVVDVETKTDAPHRSPSAPRAFADSWRPVPGQSPRLGPYLGLSTTRAGRVPVLVSAGCDRRCNFCVEARFTGHTVRHRDPAEVVTEIRGLVDLGVRSFWLACSELNVPDSRPAIALMRALADLRHLNLEYQVFIQPAPVSDALLDAIEGAGIDPTTLSFEFGHLDPTILRDGGGPCNRAAINALVALWKRRGYRQLGGSILLGAHPKETEETVRRALNDALEIDASLPDGLGLAYACGARVYPETPLADAIAQAWAESAPNLYTSDGAEPDRSFVRPVVHCRPRSPRALLAHVKSVLSDSRGAMQPMNSEAPASETELNAEALVNRGVFRSHEDNAVAAAACHSAALELVPDHLEALAQLSLLQANQLNDASAATKTLRRLQVALPPGDPRLREVRAALAQLSRTPPHP